MNIVYLHRLAKAKSVAQSLDGNIRELALWFLEYLHKDTPIPEMYARFVVLIENKDTAAIEQQIGMIKRLVSKELASRPQKC